MRIAVLIGACAWPVTALADSCTSPPPQHADDEFAETVRYVGDGDSLCVGQSNKPGIVG
ncbi:hypothetical protein U91I_03445 [alpha proteobacterium U9-1i]|nr:hypothetical protein U91I_03445 [alpha proteobacterium U9-1i]